MSLFRNEWCIMYVYIMYMVPCGCVALSVSDVIISVRSFLGIIHGDVCIFQDVVVLLEPSSASHWVSLWER